MKALYARAPEGGILVGFNNPPRPDLPSPGRFFNDPAAMFRAEMARHAERCRLRDDFFPSVLPWNNGMMVPACAGRQPLAEPRYTADTTQLWLERVADPFADLARVRLDGRNPWLRETLARYDYYRQRLPDDCALAACVCMGPDDVAVGLRGNGLYLDFVDRPAATRDLFARIADFLVGYRRRILAHVDRVAGGHLNWQGFWVPDTCFSLTADAAANYSPAMFREFTVPAIERIVRAVGGNFDMHLEGAAVHILDEVAKIPGLLILQYTNNPKLPRGIAMIDTLRAKLGDLPLRLLMTRREFLDGLAQRVLPGNCICDIGYDVEHPHEAVESPAEAEEILRLAREYRPPAG